MSCRKQYSKRFGNRKQKAQKHVYLKTWRYPTKETVKQIYNPCNIFSNHTFPVDLRQRNHRITFLYLAEGEYTITHILLKCTRYGRVTNLDLCMGMINIIPTLTDISGISMPFEKRVRSLLTAHYHSIYEIQYMFQRMNSGRRCL